MGVRDAKSEELNRLANKTLEARFRTEIQEGLNCSPFEAEAVLGVVREVYGPYLGGQAGEMPPGKISLVAIAADEPAGKPVDQCQKRNITLTVHRGSADDQILQKGGAEAFRRARLADLCQEALSQDALLTREDLAYRVFFVGTRTISRDLAALREKDPQAPIPLRSMVHDIGPVLTHRVQIVRLALEGKTTSQICQIMRHSPPAVANYVSTFTRVSQLAERKMQASQIAFLLRRGVGLIKQYLKLLENCQGDRNLSYHLAELLKLGQAGGKKRGGRRDNHVG